MKHFSLSAVASLLLGSTAFAGDITTRTMTFENEGATLSGTLYLPAGYEAGDKLPTVVITGAWTTVQAQMPAGYAKEMAERGFAAFTFDFRGWGLSGDMAQNVRFEENPQAKISDLKAAFEFVATLPEVDASQINGFGMCASAGYMVDATAANPLVQKVGLVAPWLQNQAIVNEVYGGAEGVANLIQMGRDAVAAGDRIIPAAGPAGTEGVLMAFDGYYSDPARGAIPAYDNKWNVTSWEPWLTYFPADSAATFDKPLAIVHSEAAAIPQGVRAFVAGLAGEANVTWLENVDQFSFYDREDAMNASADMLAKHFAANGSI
jgi:dienelactone hydrolase